MKERKSTSISAQARNEAYKTLVGRHMRKIGMPQVAGKGRTEEIKLFNGITLGMSLRYDTRALTRISG